MTTPPSFDNGIPELTEVIAPDVVANVATPASSAIPIPGKTDSHTNTSAPTPKLSNEMAQAHVNYSDEEWHHLETEIRDRITRQVLGRIDFVLEQRVRDSLADVLQTAVEGLANEIKQGLRVTLEDVITREIAQEITRLKTTKN